MAKDRKAENRWHVVVLASGAALSAGAAPLIEAPIELLSSGFVGALALSGWSSKREQSREKSLIELHRRPNSQAETVAELVQELGAAREESDMRYDLLTKNLAAAVVLRDENHQVIYCSPFTEMLNGYGASEILESGDDFILQTVHEDDKENFKKALSLIEMGDAFQFRYRFYHRSGLEMWGETRTVPIFDDSNQLLGSLSVTLDVTGTIRYQEQVEDQNQDLNDFAYMVSHDLKAPIYTVKGMISILEEELGSEINEDAKEAVSHMKRAVKSLESLVSGILEYSRISRSEIELDQVSTKIAVEDVLNDLSAAIKENDALIEVENELPDVMGDKLSLYQIFSNLLGNALKYRDPERAPKIFVRNLKTGNPRHELFEIEDNGIGISEEQLGNIFRPFQRVKGNRQEGLGIGLACVKKLTERLGGDISVSSALGEGTLFRLKLRKLGS